MASAKFSPASLYEHDYYAWIKEQVRALRKRRIEDVDWENVAEEVEDLAKSEKRAIESQIARLIEHLLKLSYSRDTLKRNNARGWELSVRSARNELANLLDDSPSLRELLPQMFVRSYRRGRLDALRKAKLPDAAIPETPPWTVEQVLDDAFLPLSDSSDNR